MTPTDQQAVEAVVDTFFAAFRSGPDAAAHAETLRSVLHPRAVITRTCGLDPEVYDVDSFIAPRAELLSSGRLTDFREWVVEGRVDVFGDVAHWWGSYEKSWRENGSVVTGRGMKSAQLVRTTDGWLIVATAWDDERDGVRLGG